MGRLAVSLLVCLRCGRRIEGVSSSPEKALTIAEKALADHLRLCRGSGVHHSLEVHNV